MLVQLKEEANETQVDIEKEIDSCFEDRKKPEQMETSLQTRMQI